MDFFFRGLHKVRNVTLLLPGLFLLGSWPVAGQDGDKPLVAVLGAVQSGSLDAKAVGAIREAMFEALESTARFDLVDRTAVDEQGPQEGTGDGTWNSEDAAVFGKLLAAEKIVYAEIGKLGKTYLVTVKMIDVNSGRVDHSETIDYKGKTKGLIQAVKDVCKKIKVIDQ